MSTTTTTRPTAATTTGEKKPTDATVRTWTPDTDSSPQHKAAAKADGRVHVDISDGACLCGCNQKADSRFRPGHDAKLKGMLTRAALNGAGLTLHAGDQTVQVSAEQMAAKLSGAKHDWAAALKVSVGRAKQAAAQAKVRAAEAKAKREAAAKERGESTKLDLAAFAA